MCVERCVLVAISIVLCLTVAMYTAALVAPGWQQIDDRHGMYHDVGFFFSICVGENKTAMNTKSPGDHQSMWDKAKEKAKKFATKIKRCFHMRTRSEWKEWERASMGLLLFAGLLLIVCVFWSCIMCCACCCTNCLTLPFLVLTLAAAVATSGGVAVYFTHAETPAEFISGVKDYLNNKSIRDTDTTILRQLHYSGYIMATSAAGMFICSVLSLIKICVARMTDTS